MAFEDKWWAGISPFWRRFHSPSPLWLKRIQGRSLELCPHHRHLKPRTSTVMLIKVHDYYSFFKCLLRTIHVISPGRRLLSGLRFTSSESTGLKRMLETCFCPTCKLLCCFSGSIYYLSASNLWSGLSKISIKMIASRKGKNFPNPAG